MKAIILLIGLYCGVLFDSQIAFAQENLDKFSHDMLKKAAENTVKDALADPNTMNAIVDYTENLKLGSLLKSLNLRFKAFDTRGGDESSSLGFSYDFDRAILHDFAGSSLSFNFEAKGNVAFDPDVNPNDFLDTGLRFHLFGIAPLRECPSKSLDPKKEIERAKIVASHSTERDLQEDPKWKELTKDFAENYLKEQPVKLIYDVSAHGSFESNQDLSSHQSVYGLEAGAVLKCWSPEPQYWNVFDYPGALFRMLFFAPEKELRFTPSGLSFPDVIVGFDLVDPTDDEARSMVSRDKSAYGRFRAEIAMKTKLLEIAGESVFFSGSYRHYQQFNAPRAIRRAKLDRYRYFVGVLELPMGVFLSYSNGRLPLDAVNDQVFELGLKLNF